MENENKDKPFDEAEFLEKYNLENGFKKFDGAWFLYDEDIEAYKIKHNLK